MAFAGVSFIVDGKLCDFTMSPVDAGADSGYHLLVVQGYSRTKGTTTPGAECIESRPFLVGGHRWIVKYYPNKWEKDGQKYMALYLALSEDHSQRVEAQYAFSFIDQPELRVLSLLRRSKKFVFSTKSIYSDTIFMQHEVLERSRHLKNDSFVIRCDVLVTKADNNSEEQGAGTTTPVCDQVQPFDMPSHFSNLLYTKEGADITFEVGGKKFTAHRFVLAARSTVFKAQLFGASDGGAAVPSVLRIDDIQADVFRSLLIFIYTDALSHDKEDEAYDEEGFMEEYEADDDEGGNTDGDEANEEKGCNNEDAKVEEEKGDSTEDDGAGEGGEAEEVEMGTNFLLDLLEAAVRYDLQKLKTICEEILGSCICATTVADIIVVAERSGCRWLKELCLDFMKSHTSLPKVLGTDCLNQIIRGSSAMAFAGVSFIVDGKLCDFTMSPVDAGADRGYHLLVVQGYSHTKGTTPAGKCIESRPFLVGGHRWIVEYCPNECEKDGQKYMEFYLALSEDDSHGVEAQYAFSFIDQPELRVPTLLRRSQKFVFFTKSTYGDTILMQHEVLERSRHLKNDSFVIRCDVVVIKADNNTEEQGAGTTTPVFDQVQPFDMPSHFSNLLYTKEGADITIEVGGKKFTAHRFVLAARSSVFKAQLFGVSDAVPSVLRIDDIQADVFRSLLIFIYTDALSYAEEDEAYDEEGFMEEYEADGDEGGNTDGDEANEEKGCNNEDVKVEEEKGDSTEDDGAEEEGGEAQEESGEVEYEMGTEFLLHLLEAAVRYDLPKLKTICEEMLGSCICAATVADIIVVAERSGCRWLKELCLDFIKSHTSLYNVFTADCLDQIIRTTSPSGLKELISKFPAS